MPENTNQRLISIFLTGYRPDFAFVKFLEKDIENSPHFEKTQF